MKAEHLKTLADAALAGDVQCTPIARACPQPGPPRITRPESCLVFRMLRFHRKRAKSFGKNDRGRIQSPIYSN